MCICVDDVLQRVPVPQSPIVPLKPSQELQLPLIPGGDPIRFGRGSDCDVRTDGPGVQAELSLDAAGAEMTLTFRGTMPAPGARTTAKAPHGLRVVTRMPDEFFPDGRLKNRWSKLTQVTGSYALQAGETIVFTLHAAKRTCFTVRELGPNESVAALPERAVTLKAAKRRPVADGNTLCNSDDDASSKNARRRTRSSSSPRTEAESPQRR